MFKATLRALVAPMALAATVLSPGMAAAHQTHSHAHTHGHHSHGAAIQVTISCFRGPWEEVIIDRPQPVFIDSLVAAGYTFPEAHAIAERVCRDPAGVNNSDALIATMNRIIAQNPPGR